MKNNLRPEDNIGDKKCNVCGAMCFDPEMPHVFGGDANSIRIHFPRLMELWNKVDILRCKWVNSAADPPIVCPNDAGYYVTFAGTTLPLCEEHMNVMERLNAKVEEIK